MASAQWTPVSDANSATWSKNKALTDLQADASLYDDSTITYDSPTTYYDGYNQTGTTPEGEVGAVWERMAE